MPIETQRGDRRLRLVAAVAVVCAGVAGVLVHFALQRWIGDLDGLPPAEALGRALSAFAWGVATACGSIVWLAGWLWHSGSRTVRTARFPPPGMRVIRDTPVLRGEAAARRGRLMRGAGVVLLLCATSVAVAAWRIHHLFAQGVAGAVG